MGGSWSCLLLAEGGSAAGCRAACRYPGRPHSEADAAPAAQIVTAVAAPAQTILLAGRASGLCASRRIHLIIGAVDLRGEVGQIGHVERGHERLGQGNV